MCPPVHVQAIRRVLNKNVRTLGALPRAEMLKRWQAFLGQPYQVSHGPRTATPVLGCTAERPLVHCVQYSPLFNPAYSLHTPKSFR